MKVGDYVESLYGAKGYVRGTLLTMPDPDDPFIKSANVRIKVSEIAGENRVFKRVEAFEQNCCHCYTTPVKPA